MKPRPPAGEPSQAPLALMVIDRLADAVQRETHDLNGPGPVDYRAHSQRKSQGLLELARLEATLAGAQRATRGSRAALADLLAKLDANQRLLHAKLKAARTVAELVARAICDGQSDGTYSEHDLAREPAMIKTLHRRRLVPRCAGRRRLRRRLCDEDAGGQGGGQAGERRASRPARAANSACRSSATAR